MVTEKSFQFNKYFGNSIPQQQLFSGLSNSVMLLFFQSLSGEASLERLNKKLSSQGRVSAEKQDE